MRGFVAEMASEMKDGKPRFSAKSIENYLAVIKSVVASVLNDKGEPVALQRGLVQSLVVGS